MVRRNDRDYESGRKFHRLNSHRRQKGEPLAVLKTKVLQDLSLQQKLALKYYFSGMTKNDAARKAKYKGKKAGSAIDRALETARGNQMFREAMEKAGLTPDKMMEVLKSGLDAKHPFKPEQPDWHARHKFFQDGVKIQDGYPAAKLKTESDHRHVHIHLTRDDDEQAAKFAKMRGIDVEAEDIQEP